MPGRSNQSLNEYGRRVRAWAQTLCDFEITDSTSVYLEAEKGWGGCPTCGHGDGSGIKLYVAGKEVKRWDFSRLDEVIRGILEVNPQS